MTNKDVITEDLILQTQQFEESGLKPTIECAVAMTNKDVITEDLILQTQQFEESGLKPFKDAKQGFEKDYLVQLIELTQGNITHAAKLAGKYRADLYELFTSSLKSTNYDRQISENIRAKGKKIKEGMSNRIFFSRFVDSVLVRCRENPPHKNLLTTIS